MSHSRSANTLPFHFPSSELYFLYNLSEGAKGWAGEWVGTNARCSGSSDRTRGIRRWNCSLTVSPLCPGWPGSPSFPGGPCGVGGWKIEELYWLYVCFNIWKAYVKSKVGHGLLWTDSLTAVTYVGSFGSREADGSLWSIGSLGWKWNEWSEWVEKHNMTKLVKAV